MIILQCSKCGSRFKTEDKYAGKKGKCPKCGNIILVAETQNSKANLPQTDSIHESKEVCPNCMQTVLKPEQSCFFDGRTLCLQCGQKLRNEQLDRMQVKKVESETESQNEQYARVFTRLSAFIYDGLLFLVFSSVGPLVVKIVRIIGWSPSERFISVLLFLVGFSYLMYFPLMESSSMKATVGKILVNAIVSDIKGNRISFLRAVVRNLLKFSLLPCALVSVITIVVTRKKQSLHDLIIATTVTYEKPNVTRKRS